jgi:hypothetical protein
MCDREAHFIYEGQDLCWRHFEARRYDRVPPVESTPPETPYAKQRRVPESILPRRVRIGASVSASLIALASVVAGASDLSVESRGALVALFSLVAWAVGYFTEPPRRRFRRDD